MVTELPLELLTASIALKSNPTKLNPTPPLTIEEFSFSVIALDVG